MCFHPALYSILCFTLHSPTLQWACITLLHYTTLVHYTALLLYSTTFAACTVLVVFSRKMNPHFWQQLPGSCPLLFTTVYYCSLLFPTVPLQGTIYCQVLPFYCQIGYGKGTRFESTQPKSVLRLLALKPSPPATGSLHFGLSNIWERLQCTLLWLL